MRLRCSARLLLRAAWELARYDALSRTRGFPGVRRTMRPARPPRWGAADVATVCEAVGRVSSFYWKPLQCLQRSIVTARLLRANGIAAEVVIGYRARPFFSHAWVEVGGKVVNDSPVYSAKLQLLDRF